MTIQTEIDLARRQVSHEEAKEIVRRLIKGSFRRDGELLRVSDCPKFSIPCRPDHDDDCLILAYIEQQALRSNTTVPEGYVLVPKEPTEAMLIRGSEAIDLAEDDGHNADNWKAEAREAYRAMIAASPALSEE